MIEAVQATVYRGGSRRYFTRKAARNGLAKELIRDFVNDGDGEWLPDHVFRAFHDVVVDAMKSARDGEVDILALWEAFDPPPKPAADDGLAF